ncbi:MAG: inorganic diphosphatase [Chloroflexia bacterium]
MPANDPERPAQPRQTTPSPARPDLTLYLGCHVTVLIDRPLGTRHPRHPDIRYEVNYGYIPHTLSPDGQPIDAYVLGPTKPLTDFHGEVIAVILRANDLEDKLVVAPPGQPISTTEIESLVRFQEKYFISRVVGAD